MKTGGVVAEFNPFHAGHAALVEAARVSGGCTHMVAVMSGNFVQRAAPAVAEKRVRARQALACGIDLVLELPAPYATATAQRFAKGAVDLLAATGSVDVLCFGSESGDAGALGRLAKALDEPRAGSLIRLHLEQGITYAKARQLAMEELLGADQGAQLASPNNALAVEYLRAAGGLDWQPEVFCIPRKGAAHDAPAPQPGSRFSSASYLRTIPNRFQLLERYIPHPALHILKQARREGLYPADGGMLGTAILAKLRTMSRRDLAALPDLSEGLENRLYDALRGTSSLDGLYDALKTKRYTHARIRRLVLHAFLGITQEQQDIPPPYLRVLGFTAAGQELLARMKERAKLPVDARLARLRERNDDCRRIGALEERVTDLYTLCLPEPRPCGYDLMASGIFMKE